MNCSSWLLRPNAALEHYSVIRFDLNETVFVYEDPVTHRRSHWPVEYAAGRACKILAGEDLAARKLRILERGMKELGLDHAYRRIMGVDLP